MSRKPRSGKAATAPARDHYQEVTDRIIAALEAGTRPWQRPWDPSKTAVAILPVNAVTRRPYRGINVLLLGMSVLAGDSGDPRWCTYRQAAERDWQVRRGERGTIIFFYKPLEVENRDLPPDDENRVKRIPMLRAFTMFNGSQVDGMPPFVPPTLEEAPWQRPDATDLILRSSGADVRIGGERAYYSPMTDHIQLPREAAFATPKSWGVTALHELGHWTGAPSRLDRDLSGRFGSQDYAREELRAELASLFIGTTLGLPTDIPNHASYLASWISVLKQDRREIFRAAADAQRIANYCLAFHPDYAQAREVEKDRSAGADIGAAPNAPVGTGEESQEVNDPEYESAAA